MPGPAPRATAQRPNQGAAYIKLPSEGRKGDTPPWPMPEEPRMEELEIWQYLWKLPQAIIWENLHLFRLVARYTSVLMVAESSPVPAVHTTVQQLEDRLGLNPMAMMRLRWTIVEDELADKREEIAESARKRFKAVEKSEKSA